MKTTKNLKTVLGLSLAGLVLVPSLAFAYQGDPNVQGPDCTAERHEIMEQAFANNDYNTWKSQMQGKGRVTQVVTQENFARFAQAHQLSEEGKIEEANQIKAELGLGLKNGTGNGQGKGQGQNKGTGSGRWNK